MRRYCWIIGMLALSLCAARAETFELSDGRTLIGEAIGYSDTGLVIKLSTGTLQTERVSWARLSQPTLKTLSQNPKASRFVEPFLELTPEEKVQRAGLELKPVPRVEKPKRGSLFGALGTPLGFVLFLLVYAANIYAAYEIALFRNLPFSLACGVAAILPVIGPAVLIAMPGRPFTPPPSWSDPAESAPEPEAYTPAHSAAPPRFTSGVSEQSAPPAPTSGARLASSGTAAAREPDLPATVSYSRGQFTINRRFVETKFAGFLRVVPTEAEKNLVLIVHSARGKFIGSRIVRLTPNELYLLEGSGGTTHEEMIPFAEISELQVAHKDSPEISDEV